MSDWRDIGSARKDGTRILLTDGKFVGTGAWRNGEWEIDGEQGDACPWANDYMGEVVKWMPIPLPNDAPTQHATSDGRSMMRRSGVITNAAERRGASTMSTEATEVPLICDDPAQQLRQHYVLRVDGRIDLKTAERMQEVWRSFIDKPGPALLVIDRGATLEAIGPQFIGWPDAEHCAA